MYELETINLEGIDLALVDREAREALSINTKRIDTEISTRETITDNSITLVLGDSWADQNTYSQYPNRVGWLHDRMSKNNSIHCYAVSGAQSNAMQEQLQTAENDNSFNNTSVKTIIILVGVNDFENNITPDIFAKNINNLYGQIQKVFPNATAYGLFDCVGPWTPGEHNAINCRNYFVQATNKINYFGTTIPFYYLGFYLITQHCFEAEATLETYHPSAIGQKIVGDAFDALTAHVVPSVSAIFNSTAGINNAYMFSSTTDKITEYTYSAQIRINGNNGVISETFDKMNMSIKAGNTALGIEVNLNDISSMYNSVLINPSLFTPQIGRTTSNSTPTNAIILPAAELYTGTYGGANLTNAKLLGIFAPDSTTSHFLSANFITF